ncbi:MAG: bifunctional adenosylcobinamide kinase/adenosylcobinamide-phosphate guanylyltransferase, partial [Bacteroidota bacterium]
MAYLTFITGGQRSGKSNYAKQMAEKKNKNPIYVATSRVWNKMGIIDQKNVFIIY